MYISLGAEGDVFKDEVSVLFEKKILTESDIRLESGLESLE
jgi:hypothetical protein